MPWSFARNLFVSLVCLLLGVGLVMVYSASVTARPTELEQFYLGRHLTFLGLGVAVGCAAGWMPASPWRRLAPWAFAATVLLLVAVLIPGLGHRVNGAQRWLRLGAASMQPSELAKITLPLFIAWCLEQWRTTNPGPAERLWARWRAKARWESAAVVGPITATVLLVAVEPDLGTGVFLALAAALTLFVAGWPLRNFVTAALAASPALLGLLLLKPYQMQRISGFLAAWRDVDLAPYQVRQSLTTLGVGGLNGVGLGSGWQKLSFLPEANTDFVFAVVGEELGLVGTAGLIALWIALYLTGLRLLSRLDAASFRSVAAVALLSQLVLQAALNVAVVTAMVPPKGIAHPLLSYGGSSLVVSLLTLGIVVSLSRPAAADGLSEDRPSRVLADA